MSYAPLPAYDAGPGLNFEPINNALASVANQNYRNALVGLQQQANDRANKQLTMDTETHSRQIANMDLEHERNLATAYGGWAQDILSDPDQESRLSRATALINSHPEFSGALQKNGIDPNNPVAAMKFITAEAAGYRTPEALALQRAQIAEANANVSKSNAEVAAMRRQADMFNSLDPAEFGGQPSTSSAPAIAPAASSAYAAPGVNALAAGPGTPAQPARNALAGPAAGAPAPGNALAGGTYSTPTPIGNGTQGTAAPASTSLPNPGDPTSFTGDSASGMTTPSRISPDTKRAMRFDLALNGGKGMSAILNNDPGSQYQKTFANKMAEDNEALRLKQVMTGPLLAQIQHMRQIATEAGPDVLHEATGPDYSNDEGESLLDTSGQRYQNVRAAAQAWNYPGRMTGMAYPSGVYDKAAALNLQMQHMKKMLGAAVKSLPGTKGGGASTDQDQALVLDAVGEALHAQDPETFFKILFDAENGLRARAGQPALAQPKSYLPDSWASRAESGGPSNGSAAAVAGARDAIAKGADPAAVRQRLIQNGINPDGL